MKVSEVFEGEGSSLHQAYVKATTPEKVTPTLKGVEENWRDEYKGMEQSWMHLKDQYAELARALGFEGDTWFGDPLVGHGEIVSRARTLLARDAAITRCKAAKSDHMKTYKGDKREANVR